MNPHLHTFAFPAAMPPAWASLVDRWYALDAYAYGLADAAAEWRRLARPDLILLASPAASNASDWNFAKGGAVSPAKFVHTLPSARASALLLVLEWRGPVLCLQHDPTTVESAREEAKLFDGKVWVCGSRRTPEGYEAYLYE